MTSTEIRKRYTRVRKNFISRGYVCALVVDHQMFCMPCPEPQSRAHAEWVREQLVIALTRMAKQMAERKSK